MKRSCAGLVSKLDVFGGKCQPILTAASVRTFVTLNVIKSWGLLRHCVDGSGLTLQWSENGRQDRLSVSMQPANAAVHIHIIQ